MGKMNGFWKRTFIYPKWLHNRPIVIPKWTKVTTIYPKSLQNRAKLTPEWRQSHPKATLICQHWPQSDANVPPKSLSNAKSKPKVGPKLPESHPHMRKSPQNDPKVAPKSISNVKSDAKVIPKSHSYAKICPKVILNAPHRFINSLQSDGKMNVFLKTDLHIPKATPQLSHSAPIVN